MAGNQSGDPSGGTGGPKSIVLPVFEVDCSDWLADEVPQTTGRVYQNSIVVGPPEDDAPVDRSVLEPIRMDLHDMHDLLEIIERALHLAISEARRRESSTDDIMSKKLIHVTTRDFLQMAQALETTRSRLQACDPGISQS